jgi:epoxyqueuosine reductase
LAALRSGLESLLTCRAIEGETRNIADRFRRLPPDEAALGFAARSVALVAAPSPLVRLRFGGVSVDMPPTYTEFGTLDDTLTALLSEELAPYRFADAQRFVPCKALAVRSGLAEYGRNHISYIKGLGSFFRLAALLTDKPAENFFWGERRVMDACAPCGLCRSRCPTGALGGPALRAERCLTHYNEDFGPLPDWIDPGAHNALIGCMRCQADCPQNAKAVKASGPDVSFSRGETDALLTARVREDLPEGVSAKLASVGLTYDEYFREVILRNLRLLLKTDLTEGL